VELECSRCGAPIASEDVHVELAIAKCAACHAVLDLMTRQTVDDGGAPAVHPRPRAPVPLPEEFDLRDSPRGLSVSWRWFSRTYLLMLGFCAFWDGFMVLWYALAIANRLVLMGLFGLLHAGVGVWLTYWTLAGLLNRTRVEVRGGVLSIRHFPIPWRGNRDLRARDIDQLFCAEETSHGRDGTDGAKVTYQLKAILKSDGHTMTLLSGLNDPQQALFLEQRLEEKLGIEDRPVGGELALRQSA
jgi:hypothetical protein